MNQLVLILPELFLSVAALAVLVGDAFLPNWRRAWIHVSVAALLAATAACVAFFWQGAAVGAAAAGLEPLQARGGWIQYPPVLGMISVDSLAMFFKIAVLATVVIVLWLSADYREFGDAPMGTYCALFLLGTVGMMLLVGSVDFLMAVIALELLSITSFILSGFVTRRRSAGEGALKFFLVGSFSTALILFGLSYYYGVFGTTRIDPLLSLPRGGVDAVLSLIVVFLVSGLGFKLAMVPFHMWAPDTYEGAPTPVTAFLSAAPKVATVGFLLRILSRHADLNFTGVLAVLAAITMTVGNVGALQQTNVKRLLAYSSIAQVGYILVALVAGGALGGQAAMIYAFVYLFMNLGVFCVLVAVSNASQSDDIDTFAGLYKSSFGLAVAALVFLLSMTGIPPLAGFVGKFAVFAALIKGSGLLWLAIVTVINSVISLYYYFRIVHQMFFREAAADRPAPRMSPVLTMSLAVTLAVTVAVGLAPNGLLSWIRNVVGS